MVNISQVGIDLVDVKRFNHFDLKSKLARNVFSDKEIKELKDKSKETLAGRFAAKESVLKTIEETVKLNKIEVLSEKSGKPFVKFLDSKLRDKYRSKISISHTKDQAVAICFTKINYEK